jgi:hypothetical protein
VLAANFMGSNFKVQDYQDGKLVQLSSPYSRTRILDFFYALNFFVGTIGFGYLLLTDWNKSIMASIIAILAIVGFSIAFYRFINKATEIEKLFVNKQRLDIMVSSLFKVRKRSFLLADISDFKFLEKERYEAHPLKGETFDYLGFQTEQQVIQDLHSEGRASFVCNGRQVRFGKELVSWEFNELEVLLYDLTGNDFRYTDKYEQENFPQN